MKAYGHEIKEVEKQYVLYGKNGVILQTYFLPESANAHAKRLYLSRCKPYRTSIVN